MVSKANHPQMAQEFSLVNCNSPRYISNSNVNGLLDKTQTLIIPIKSHEVPLNQIYESRGMYFRRIATSNLMIHR